MRSFPGRKESFDLSFPCERGNSEPRFLFSDEIQAVEGWERFVRRAHDTERFSLFVTGSAPHLLSRQMAPVLRGRGLSRELWPLNFAEALQFRDIVVQPYERLLDARLAGHRPPRSDGFDQGSEIRVGKGGKIVVS